MPSHVKRLLLDKLYRESEFKKVFLKIINIFLILC